MKTILFHACFLLALAASASAEIIGVETFDYPDGPIAGKTGGTFWDWKNTAPTSHDSTPSDWNNDVGAPQVVSGRLITQNTRARRENNGPLEGLGVGSSDEDSGAVNPGNVQKVWYARVTVTTGATLPNYLGVSAYDFGTERIFFGRRIGQANWGIETFNGFGAVNSAVPVAINTTYTLVAKVDYVAQKLRLFINPDLNAAEPTTAAAEITSYTANNWTTSVRLGDGSGGGASTWDNLVVATTWADLGTVVNTTADTDGGASVLNAGGAVSLREAVKYSPSGTLITFDPALNGQTIMLTAGELQNTVSPIVTVDGSSLASGLTIDGNRASRLFHVFSGQTTTLRSLTLTGGNGVASASGGSGSGGAVFNNGSVTLTDCTLANNTGNGGAIFSQGGSLTLTRCTLTGNSASSAGSAGGALISAAGTNVLDRCTVSGNSNAGAFGGGGIYVQAPATLSLRNTIVAGNVDTSGIAADIRNLNGSTISAFGANLIGQNTSVESTFPAGPLVGTAAAPLNPRLSPLGYYGGPTQTMHPLVGSPAIDAGGTTPPSPNTDQRGFPGFVDGDNSGTAQLDIGAVEAGPLRTVTSIVDGQAGNLRDVINSATVPGTHIVFAPGYSDFGFLLLNGELSIANKTLFIDASDQPAAVKISGQNNTRVFYIDQGATVAMQNLVIANGRSSSDDGGGIENGGGTLTLNQCTLASNSTTSDGGAISNDGGTMVINQCTLSDNAGGLGGAIYTSGTVTVRQSTFARNGLQTAAEGGAIYNEADATLSVFLSTVSGNAAGFGGGIYNNGTLNLENSIVYGNTLGGNVDGSFNSIGTNITSGADPLLAPLGDYGGPTQTMALKPGSRARDAAGTRSEVQQVNIGSLPSTFTLTFKAATTPTLPFDATASQVQNALTGLSTIGSGNVAVSFSVAGNNNHIFTVTFQGSLSGIDQPQLTGAGQSTPTITTLQDGYTASPATSDQRGFPIVGAPDIGAYEAGTLNNYNAFIWETLPATATDAQHAATFDFDGDGANNFGEYVAGTVVADAQSVFRVKSLSFASDGKLNVVFPSVLGRTYSVEQSTDLNNPNAWALLPGTITGTGNDVVLIITPPANTPRYFLRPRVSL